MDWDLLVKKAPETAQPLADQGSDEHALERGFRFLLKNFRKTLSVSVKIRGKHPKSPVLSAKRKSDGQIVEAYFESKASGPFSCPVCGDEVILRVGKGRVTHFAHAYPLACQNGEGEGEEHRRCKQEIYQALLHEPNVQDVVLERSFGQVRPDISAYIGGIPVAIEVQISSLSVETIIRRTVDYARKGIYVLWLLQWTPELDSNRYASRPWEKWLHAAYFGRVYYWIDGVSVVSYHFDASFKSIPRTSWYSSGGKKMTTGGYSRKLKRYRTGIRGKTFNLARDFAPQKRNWWEGNGVVVPDAKLFMQSYERTSSSKKPY